MDYENTTSVGFPFLEEERTKKYFADLNIKLLSGKHIQADDFDLHTLITDFFCELSTFYSSLYQLNLVREVFDDFTYFYLDFFGGSHGKLSDPSRYRLLTEWQTTVGLMLLDLYYTHYFEEKKEIRWSNIKQEIEAGDKREALQKLFFGEVRDGFSPGEWSAVEKKWRDTVNSFEELGWVYKKSKQGSELRFEIRPAIHRLATLYTKELEHLDDFITVFKENKGQ